MPENYNAQANLFVSLVFSVPYLVDINSKYSIIFVHLNITACHINRNGDCYLNRIEQSYMIFAQQISTTLDNTR